MDKKRHLNYIVKQYHTDPNIKIWYEDLTTGKYTDQTENKFGITTVSPTDTEVGRFKELNRTKAPIGCIAIKVFEAKDEIHQRNMENAFKILCGDKRITSNGLTEYYNIPTETGIAFYESQGAIDVSNEFIDETLDDAGANKTRKKFNDPVKNFFHGKDNRLKWNQYFANQKFKHERPDGLEQIITILPNDGIHCDTEDTTIMSNDRDYSPNYAFEHGLRKKLIREGIVKDNPDNIKSYWYGKGEYKDTDWQRNDLWKKYWKSFNNSWDTINIETGKTLHEMATEIYNKETK